MGARHAAPLPLSSRIRPKVTGAAPAPSGSLATRPRCIWLGRPGDAGPEVLDLTYPHGRSVSQADGGDCATGAPRHGPIR